MALFEGYERRIDKINETLKKYGISSIEEAKKICDDAGVDVYSIVKGIQPIAFENAVWAYTLGAAIAIKKGSKNAAEAAENGTQYIVKAASAESAAVKAAASAETAEALRTVLTAVLVVIGALVLVGEHLIGVVYLLELFLGGFFLLFGGGRIAVGVILERHLAISALYLLFRSVLIYSECFVKVLCHINRCRL